MADYCSKAPAKSAAARSRVSNGKGLFLDNVDGRSAVDAAPVPDNLESDHAAPAKAETPHTTVSEQDAAWPTIALNGNLRVIECRDSIQWIIQRAGGERWRPLSYHRQRDSLIAKCEWLGMSVDALRYLSLHAGHHLPR